jgi:5-methylcytosine-specific restriction endonuclease McrA
MRIRKIVESALSVYRRTSPVAPTGPSADERKAAERAARAALIARVRAEVFRRDTHCRVCGKPGSRVDQMHEIRSRALLRGRPDEEIFCTANCLRVDRRCHARLTGTLGGGRLWLKPLTRDGANGAVMVVSSNPWLDMDENIR